MNLRPLGDKVDDACTNRKCLCIPQPGVEVGRSALFWRGDMRPPLNECIGESNRGSEHAKREEEMRHKLEVRSFVGVCKSFNECLETRCKDIPLQVEDQIAPLEIMLNRWSSFFLYSMRGWDLLLLVDIGCERRGWN
jgi:hypothetical protein